MFYHIEILITGLTSWIVKNKTKEDVLIQYVCPFINKEITLQDNYLMNIASYGGITIIETSKPIDSDWPIKKADFFESNGNFKEYDYEKELKRKLLNEFGEEVTKEFFVEGLRAINTGKYVEERKKLLQDLDSKTAFFICPFENKEIDHNYEFVVKPLVEKYQIDIKRADEISHTRTINEIIISSINKAHFIIADLSEERPNCYYEVGYAHSLGKPVIIIAKNGTVRHFDISTYKWNYYTDYKDLKTKLEKEISVIVSELKI